MADGAVKVVCDTTGEHLLPLNGVATVGALQRAVCSVVGGDAEARDVVYVPPGGGETVLDGDDATALAEVGIVGADECVEVRVSGKGAARAELTARGVDAESAVRVLRDVLSHPGGGLDLAYLVALSGWVGREGLEVVAQSATLGDAAAAGLVAEFVSGGADINARGSGDKTALHVAVEENNASVAKALLRCHADVDARACGGATPCLLAGLYGCVDAMRAVIAGGGDVNKADTNLYTPCYVAAQDAHERSLKLLIEAGADVNATCGHSRETACHVTALEGHTGVMSLLIEAGAVVDATRDDGATACYLAAREGHADVVEALVKAGANVNIAADDCATPCLAACEGGHVGALRVLIAAKADVNRRREDGASPYSLARAAGRTDLLQVLVDAGADGWRR